MSAFFKEFRAILGIALWFVAVIGVSVSSVYLLQFGWVIAGVLCAAFGLVMFCAGWAALMS